MTERKQSVLVAASICNTHMIQLVQGSHLLGGHLIDAIVSEKHYGTRDPEGDAGRDDGVDSVNDKLAPVRMLHPIQQMFIRCVPIYNWLNMNISGVVYTRAQH